MNSAGIEEDENDSVICLDSSSDDINNDDLISQGDADNTLSDRVNFEKTLPPGVAPDGFILLDEDVDNNVEENETSKPMFKVLFRDESVARQYKRRIRDFLHRLLHTEPQNDESDLSSIVLEVWGKKSEKKSSRHHENIKKMEVKKESETSIDNLLFTVDKRPNFMDGIDVPAYGKKFDQVMDKSSGNPNENIDNKKPVSSKNSCWNCSGDHAIRDCPEPRNQANITKNRANFMWRQGPKISRYHVDDELKYGHLVPGHLSNNLRRALGLREDQLPVHIYRMRMLGYPPGWLKEAKLQHSGLNLYNSEGARESDPLEEPGEIAEFGDKDQYNVNKIHDFPGFNVPSAPGTREEEIAYWYSEQYLAQSKQAMLSTMRERMVDGYKRKKLKRTAPTSGSDFEAIPSEMDVVEQSGDTVVESVPVNGLFIPPLPKSPPRPPLPLEPEESRIESPRPSHLDLESVASPTYGDSPSLADLERRKKQLLEELDDSSLLSAPATPLTSRSCSSQASDTEPMSVVGESTPQSNKTLSVSVTPSRGSVKSVALGTPLLQSTSPYSKLPSVENFSKDVCDLMHFENLPDSTGKYEQMTEILQKVRSTLGTIPQE